MAAYCIPAEDIHPPSSVQKEKAASSEIPFERLSDCKHSVFPAEYSHLFHLSVSQRNVSGSAADDSIFHRSVRGHTGYPVHPAWT